MFDFVFKFLKAEAIKYVQRRDSSKSNVSVEEPKTTTRARDWQITFDVDGRAGETKSVTVKPDVHAFRGEKLIVYDTLPDEDDVNGTRTKVVGIVVGSKNQMPTTASGVLSQLFSVNSRSGDYVLDTCSRGSSITYTVLFLVDCRWSGTLFGKVVF